MFHGSASDMQIYVSHYSVHWQPQVGLWKVCLNVFTMQLLCMNSALPDYLVKQAQQTLVQIWQLNIQQWYAGEDLARTSNSNQRTFVGDLISENGHMLAPRENQQGMWCRLCGKCTNNMKHIRLKITRTDVSKKVVRFWTMKAFITTKITWIFWRDS